MDTTRFLRNRLAVAVGTLLLLLSVFGTWQALRAQMQTHRAVERETEISRLLDELDRNSAGRTPPASRAGRCASFARPWSAIFQQRSWRVPALRRSARRY